MSSSGRIYFCGEFRGGGACEDKLDDYPAFGLHFVGAVRRKPVRARGAVRPLPTSYGMKLIHLKHRTVNRAVAHVRVYSHRLFM